MAAGPNQTNAWLARYYKFKLTKSMNPFAKPKAEISNSHLCILYGMEIVSLEFVTARVIDGKVKHFDHRRLDHSYVERKGGYHLQIVGRINIDGSVSQCPEPVTSSRGVFVMVGALMNITYSNIKPFLMNSTWVSKQDIPMSPLEEKYPDIF